MRSSGSTNYIERVNGRDLRPSGRGRRTTSIGRNAKEELPVGSTSSESKMNLTNASASAEHELQAPGAGGAWVGGAPSHPTGTMDQALTTIILSTSCAFASCDLPSSSGRPP